MRRSIKKIQFRLNLIQLFSIKAQADLNRSLKQSHAKFSAYQMEIAGLVKICAIIKRFALL